LGVDQPLVAGLLPWVVMLLVVVVAGVLVVVDVVVNPLRIFWYVGEVALLDRRRGELPLGGRLSLLVGVVLLVGLMMVGMVVWVGEWVTVVCG
jgi:hypothetical protein